jgi:hypothetical protein
VPDLFSNAEAVGRLTDDVLDALAVVVADVSELRPRHLGTLFEWTPADLRPAVAAYVREARPDLARFLSECLTPPAPAGITTDED